MGLTTTVIDYDFNTSHVNVNQLEDKVASYSDNFNTSHVNVNQ